VNSDQPLSPRLILFVFGDDAAAAMRTFPVAPLEVSARVSDLFTTVLARYGDLFVFRHTAGITESCLECILGSAEGEKQCARAQLSVNGFGYRIEKREQGHGVPGVDDLPRETDVALPVFIDS
jgi:hypothetical protein